ncbi:WYL domain-containing protein [Microbaculum marinisediminis]|uniref:WYL domain-containing protein n=1 Tax=Microbaculum marinisediminis TaxID=2931392 RepID=A0AAW5R4F4_9HYPH|nr:WYL domain-containing protein [Microbaculum sp. A6E488]MCT8974009.1 WYL domain-containing protein [Microbaculum sp. A6E488]
MCKDAIIEAIRAKAIVRFTYSQKIRTAEPHLLGYDSDGDLTLSAWQLTGTGQGWRDFHVSKLSGLATTGDNFERARPDYNPDDSTLQVVLARL